MVKILILQILGLETVEFFGMRCFTLIRPEIENVRNEDVELIKMSFVILKVKRFPHYYYHLTMTLHFLLL